MSNPAFKEKAYVPNDTIQEDNVKLYVLINRKNLSLVQAGVQASHAIAEYGYQYANSLEYRTWVRDHKTLIFLEASEKEMLEVSEYFERHGMTFSKFFEPDLNNLLTAIAFQPLKSKDGKIIFGSFKLLK
jgi:hypothetical protein